MVLIKGTRYGAFTEEQIKAELAKIKEIKRKQKAEQKKKNEELGRMLSDRFPGITLETFEEFISEKVNKPSDESAPQGEKQGLMSP